MSKKIKGIIIHWSDSGPLTTREDIERWHKARGFRAIGYNWVILNEAAFKKDVQTPGYLVKVGREVNDDLYLEGDEIGAHTLGFNSEYIGICVISSPKSPMSELQKVALNRAVFDLIHRFKLGNKDIYGHRDFNKTECPGDALYREIQQMRLGNYVFETAKSSASQGAVNA